LGPAPHKQQRQALRAVDSGDRGDQGKGLAPELGIADGILGIAGELVPTASATRQGWRQVAPRSYPRQPPTGNTTFRKLPRNWICSTAAPQEPRLRRI